MGTPYKYTREILGPAVEASTSVAGVLRALGLRANGGSHADISRTIKKLDLDTSHFRPTRKGERRERLPAGQILTLREPGSARAKPHMLRRAMLESGVSYVCVVCANDGSWQGLPLQLEVDHVDGDFHNNVLSNLRFLCPNCHRQTPNHAGRSRGKFTDAIDPSTGGAA